jgi:tetratricopeptide (TPR) repeat protein
MVDFSGTGSLSADRVIRVFVSSTFRDMQAEREELIKRIFPQLRKICELRGVTWGEVDLRWGVSDEQKAEGQVLPICLDEIRRCRPYFIGLLGDRYGWILDDLDPAILAREPWLANYRGRSVTEIEMVSGVLDNPQMADHAFFYFRDPSASAVLASGLPPELPTPSASARLDALKHRIRGSSFPVRENYESPQQLGELILADFTRLIDRLFPQDKTPDPLDREAKMHEVFALNRARVYIGSEDYYQRLDASARGDGAPLVVLGDSGLGKSALLANWMMRYRAAHPDEFIFMHFIGASPASADWTALARRLIGELNRRFGMTIEIPDQADALRKAFANGLRIAGAMHRLIIVLDALNQLDDRDQAPDLVWLPRDLPPRVRLIASALPGRALDETARRGWQTLTLAPLQQHERERLIVDYLAQYAKTLGRSQIALVAAAPMAGNPLFLTALLEELRVWGVYETLETQLEYYLSAPSIGDLFQRILARYENDYDRGRARLVRDAMSAIWAARHGLSEAELLDLLGHDGAPLPRAYWAPLYLAAERSIVSHSGLLGFFHDYLRQAVRERYLPTEQQQREAHLRLADYFAPRELNPRKSAELPWQLMQAQRWQRLADTLADLSMVRSAWGQNGHDIYGYWSKVEENIPRAIIEAYRPVVDTPAQQPQDLKLLSRLLMQLNYPQESTVIQMGLIETYQREFRLPPGAAPLSAEDADYLAKEIISLTIEASDNLRALREFASALAATRKAVETARHFGDRQDLGRAIAHQGIVLLDLDKPAEAKQCFDEAEDIARSIGSKSLLGMVLGNQSNLVADADPARALALQTENESLIRESGDQQLLSACIVSQGKSLWSLGDLDAASKRLEAAAQLSRDIGYMQGLCVALWYQSLLSVTRQDGDGALKLLAQHEVICRRIGDKKSLALSLRLQAETTAGYRGDFAAALKLLQAHEQVCAELGDKLDTATGLLLQADLLMEQNVLGMALEVLQKAEPIFRDVGDKARLADVLAREARCHESRGRGGEATQSLKEAERLYREVGDFKGLSRAIFDQARLFYEVIRMPAAALPGMRQAQELAEAHGLSSLAQEIKGYADRISAPANQNRED